jgi:pyridoxine kinase
VLSARGVQCCPLPTAILSAPANYEGHSVFSLTEQFPPILRHLASLNTEFDAVYSGYLAGEEQAAFVEEVFEAFPNALRVTDPVLGDRGKLYRTMGGGMVNAIRRLSKKAHIITPNVTEAAILLGKPPSALPHSDEETKNWLHALTETYSQSAVITGLSGETAVGWAKDGENGIFCHPRTKGDFHGTGDLFTACLLAQLLHDTPLSDAAKTAAEFVADCTALTAERGADAKEGVLFEGVLKISHIKATDYAG